MALLGIFKKKKKEEKIPKKAVEKEKPKAKVLSRKKEKKGKLEAKIESKAYRVLIRPLISEKATTLGTQNKYVFMVARNATKIDIKRAIEDVYGIRPISVRTINILGKQRRYGRTVGKTRSYKKAIVTLPPGKTIQIYEGV